MANKVDGRPQMPLLRMHALRDAICAAPRADLRRRVERPILFNEAMVIALLSGRKTVTRRLVRGEVSRAEIATDRLICFDRHDRPLVCPLGQAGDRLWVREKWMIDECRAGQIAYRYFATRGSCESATTWRPSLHMPRAASRISLLITDVRIDRLKQMTDADARAEGYDQTGGKPLAWFRELWNSLPQNDGSRWEDNPWVWVIAFDVHASTGSTPA